MDVLHETKKRTLQKKKERKDVQMRSRFAIPLQPE